MRQVAAGSGTLLSRTRVFGVSQAQAPRPTSFPRVKAFGSVKSTLPSRASQF